MSIDAIFDTNVLIGVVRNLKLPSQFMLNTFFPNGAEVDTEYVSVDVEYGKRRMSPFVSPLVEGKPVESRKFMTNSFRPAYIKDLRTPDFRRPVMRAIGERFMGEMTPEERIQVNLAFEMEDQIQMVDRRLEWMAAQAMTTGSILIAGDGFESVLMNFGRDPALTVDISATGTNAPWAAAPAASSYYATPSQNIEIWSRLVLQKSGVAPDIIVFDTNAYDLFLADQRVQQSVWYTRSGDSNIEFGGTPTVQGAVFKGAWSGYRLYVYNDWYVDQAVVTFASGSTSMTIPSGTTLTVGSTLATTLPGPNGSANGIDANTTVTAIVGTTATLSKPTLAAGSGIVLDYEAPMIPSNSVILASSALQGARVFASIMDEDFMYRALAYAPKSWVEKNPSRRHLLMQSSPLVVPTRVNAMMFAKVA